jgi:DNA mismatch repair ATPase MutS
LPEIGLGAGVALACNERPEMHRSIDPVRGSVPRVSLPNRPTPADQSILFARAADRPATRPAGEAFFADLHLDQIIKSVTTGREKRALESFFRTPLENVDAIQFRHEVFRDLEDSQLIGAIKSFTEDMSALRDALSNADHTHHKHQRHAWFLEAACVYGDTIRRLARQLEIGRPQSRGLIAFRSYLARYAKSAEFERLATETKRLKADLVSVRYCLDIKSDRISVRKYDSEDEYSSAVLATFGKFRQGTARDYAIKRAAPASMNHIEAAILDLVARLYPDLFAELEAYCATYAGFPDATIAAFDHEIQFYAAYLEFMAIYKPAALSFCYPEISATDKAVCGSQCFDLALAGKCISENAAIVCNDFFLEGAERILVVSGPNQGGKTTFARMFGQIHFLASLGCPVPGEKARLFLFDRLFTHFEREEDITTQQGRLENDLVRIHETFGEATSSSIVIMNEIFSSTTFSDALALSKKILARIVELDLLCVFVTFIDELATLNEKTVSFVGTVDEQNPERRTYRILRRPADGLAYAMSVAEKYGLNYRSLKERIKL